MRCYLRNPGLNFNLFRLPQIIEVFDGLNIHEYVYEDWIEALMSEKIRGDRIESELNKAPDIWDKEYWRGKGYRTWLPLFYYIYHDLKQHSIRNKEWQIDSGQNNPAMYWKKGLLPKNILGYNVIFYWEFNYEEFFLKVQLDENNKLPQGELNKLRDKIATICYQETQRGQRTQNRYGVYNSLYKWDFDFKKQDFADIMKEVDDILDKIHPQLSSL